ncbi:hypothetical protein RDE2_13580 [Rhodococcus sp. RDE2]|nr:hypothetical protein RDE2_13580 [Rhodococcus sp. RDE2]
MFAWGNFARIITFWSALMTGNEWCDRIQAGPCDWRYGKDCWAEFQPYRQSTATIGAAARLETLVKAVKAGTIEPDPAYPPYEFPLSGFKMMAIGELRAHRRQRGRRLHARIYYTQPQFDDHLLFGAKFGEKPDSNDDPHWRDIQDAHMAEAASRALVWGTLPEEQRTCASCLTSTTDETN